MFFNRPESPQKFFPRRPGGCDIYGHKEFFKINRPAFVRIESAKNVLAKLFCVPRRKKHFIHVNESLRREFSTGAVLQEASVPLSIAMIKYYGATKKRSEEMRRNHLYQYHGLFELSCPTLWKWKWNIWMGIYLSGSFPHQVIIFPLHWTALIQTTSKYINSWSTTLLTICIQWALERRT